MDLLGVDFEAYNPAKGALAGGGYLYWQDPATEPMCACFSASDGYTEDWEVGQPLPQGVLNRLEDMPVVAHNVEFDARPWRVLGWPEPKHGWIDSMHLSRAVLGVGSLAEAAKLALPDEERKLDMPRLMPWRFLSPLARENVLVYCRQDTRACRMLAEALLPYVSDWEIRASQRDLLINERGVPIDLELAQALVDMYKVHGDKLIEMSGVDVTLLRSNQQLTSWLGERGFQTENCQRQTLEDLLDEAQHVDDEDPRAADSEHVIKVLEARLGLSVIGGKKAEAALRLTGPDGRVRDHLNHRVASTGRAGGRGIQLQNLPRANIARHHADALREAVVRRDFDGLVDAAGAAELPIQKALSAILRQMVAAPEGRKLVGTDLSAIEARMLAWDAGQEDMVEAFRENRDIYAEFGEKYLFRGMKLKKGVPERDLVCKPVVLGSGYQMGEAKHAAQMLAMDVDLIALGTTAKRNIQAYRKGYPRIPALWKRLENQAMECVRSGEPVGCFRMAKGPGRWSGLEMVLPSGRPIRYRDARLEMVETMWGTEKEAVVYNRRGAVINMYGGRWTENRIQGMSWDVLEHCLEDLDDGNVILHVHDEAVEECADEEVEERLARQKEAMSRTPGWAPGAPISCAGEATQRYS